MAVAAPHSKFPGTSLAYITIGGLLATLSGTSYFFWSNTEGHTVIAYLRAVTLIGGIGMVVLGFCVGFIGRVARTAELPPTGAVTVPANPETVAANPPGMMAAASAPPRHA